MTMPITASAKKAHKVSEKKAVFNLRRKEDLKETIKKIKKLVSQKDIEGAEKLIPQAYKVIDKAAKRGVIKDNTASRKKSRLVSFIKKAKA